MVGSMNRIVVQASLSKKRDPVSKITRAKGAGGALPSKHKALSSNPSDHQKKKNKVIFTERNKKSMGFVCRHLNLSLLSAAC
jgi:hypothetical protein